MKIVTYLFFFSCKVVNLIEFMANSHTLIKFLGARKFKTGSLRSKKR